MPIISISRGTFSGAEALAEGVAAQLRIPCYSREVIVKAGEEAGTGVRDVEESLDSAPSYWERFGDSSRVYAAFVRAHLLELACHGSFVYHGNSAHLLLADLPNVVRLRVLAPLGKRLEVVMAKSGLDARAAKRHIEKIDKHRDQWARLLYGVDWKSPELYDLVINLEHVELDEAVAMACLLARARRFQWTDALRTEVADRALAQRVTAALARQGDSYLSGPEVTARDGVVTIRGTIKFEETRRAVAAAAQAVRGVARVDSQLSIPADALRD